MKNRLHPGACSALLVAIALAAGCGGTAPPIGPRGEPVAAFSFESGITDEGPRHLPVQIVGGARLAKGFHGQGLFVEGKGDSLALRLTDEFHFDRGITLELWFKREDWTNPYTEGGNGQTLATVASVTLRLSIRNGYDASENLPQATIGWQEPSHSLDGLKPVPPNVWTHLAVTYDSGRRVCRFYVNGKPVKTATGIAPVPAKPHKQFGIGTWYEKNNAFRGTLDDIRLYDYARTEEEVAVSALP